MRCLSVGAMVVAMPAAASPDGKDMLAGGLEDAGLVMRGEGLSSIIIQRLSIELGKMKRKQATCQQDRAAEPFNPDYSQLTLWENLPFDFISKPHSSQGWEPGEWTIPQRAAPMKPLISNVSLR